MSTALKRFPVRRNIPFTESRIAGNIINWKGREVPKIRSIKTKDANKSMPPRIFTIMYFYQEKSLIIFMVFSFEN